MTVPITEKKSKWQASRWQWWYLHMQWTTGEQKKKSEKLKKKVEKYHVASSVSPMQWYTVEMRRLGFAHETQESGQSIAKERLAAQFLIYQ